MLAEIAAANAAFKVVKGAIANGKELHQVAQQATAYFDSKSAIAQKANKRGNKSDMEAFMALEALKEQETELKEVMIYNGRANMYDDWLKFQSQCKRARIEEKLAARRKALAQRRTIVVIFTAVCSALVGIPVIGVLAWSILKLFGAF